jgi:hypothetical protein
VRIDPFTQREVITLAGDQDRTIDVDWPDYDTADVGQIVAAVAAADATGKMPPEVTLELLLQALGVEDVDEILAKYTDEEGNFVIPEDASAARSQQDAVARGDVPPADGGPVPNQPPGDQRRRRNHLHWWRRGQPSGPVAHYRNAGAFAGWDVPVWGDAPT